MAKDDFVCPIAFLDTNITDAEREFHDFTENLIKTAPSSIAIASVLLGLSLFILIIGKKLT